MKESLLCVFSPQKEESWKCFRVPFGFLSQGLKINRMFWWRNQNLLSSPNPAMSNFSQLCAEWRQPAWATGRFMGVKNKKLWKVSRWMSGCGAVRDVSGYCWGRTSSVRAAAEGCCNMKLPKGQRPCSAACSLPICAISWNNRGFQGSFSFFPAWPLHPLPPLFPGPSLAYVLQHHSLFVLELFLLSSQRPLCPLLWRVLSWPGSKAIAGSRDKTLL